MNQEHYAAVRYAMVIGFIAGGIDQFENPSLTAGFAVAALHTELLPLIAALRQNPELVELSRKVGLGHLFGSFSGGNKAFSGGNGSFSGEKTKQSKKTAVRYFFAEFNKLSNENKTVLDRLVANLGLAFSTKGGLARRKTAKSHQ